MSKQGTNSDRELPEAKVLTLAEVAAYLRVPEEAVKQLVADDALAARNIGSELRFHKQALVDWLRFGPQHFHKYRMIPPLWFFEHPY